jgi:hypothetical protein
MRAMTISEVGWVPLSASVWDPRGRSRRMISPPGIATPGLELSIGPAEPGTALAPDLTEELRELRQLLLPAD